MNTHKRIPISSAPSIMEIFNNDLDSKILSSSNSGKKLKKKNEFFENLFSSELERKYEIEEDSVECLDLLDGLGSVAWYLCNNRYKTIPSSIYIEKKYNLGLLDFLKTNGKVSYKKLYDSNEFPEATYVFFYNGCYYNIIVSQQSSEETLIHGFGIYHPLNIIPDVKSFDKFLEEVKPLPKIGIIKTTRFGPAVTWIDHKTDLKFDYDNYNQDFSEFFDDMKEKITGENKTGLYLFYGEAGTGKSSAIRHLISQIDRPVVYLPPQMINSLSTPEFTDLLTTTLKGSILVIEDAEKALMKRETEDGFFNSELVSSILNLTDGLYADIAQTSIIATYNCDRNMVDTALLRKGRLRSEYNFKKLSIERTQKLMDNLGHEINIDEPMSLADIYNYQKQYTNKKKEKKRPVGFGG
jgi:hypothetical protein